MDLYIYKYNNYYNRIVKKEETLLDYGEYIHLLSDCRDFSPNDGVNTTHIFGSAANNYNGEGDYAIVADGNDIISRWFILDIKFTRHGQWQITLHRDLVVDFYDNIVNAPCFIEKATLPSNSPLIFNSEQMTLNQIKTRETLIKDKSGCPWIVGYYAKNAEENNLKGSVARNLLDDVYNFALDTPIEDWEFYQYQNNDFISEPTNTVWNIWGQANNKNLGKLGIYYNYNLQGEYLGYKSKTNQSTIIFDVPYLYEEDLDGKDIEVGMKAKATELATYVPSYVTYNNTAKTEEFFSFNNSIVKDSLGKYFQIVITPNDSVEKVSPVAAGSLFNELNTIVYESAPQTTGSANTSSFTITTNHAAYRIGIKELESLETQWDLSGSKLTTENAPYNVFAIPYGAVELKLNGQTIVTSTAEDSMALAASMIIQMDSVLYDIQLLPYCPLVLDEDAIINVKSDLNYSLVTAPGATESDPRIPIGFILNVANSRFTKNIYLDDPIVIQNAKLENECDIYKLCSPNWASEYQFSAAKNGGIQYFNVDCEYKPYTPYIHINPNFGGLYGRDFDDARGLILSGDFSLSQISDAWQQYQTQNKNFQNIFDRQIQNMEVQHKAGRIQDIVGSIAGAGQGAASGALLGSMLPGMGTAIGAVGGGLSAAAGVADYFINEMLRNEAMDYTKDLFGYQLGNIQALPYTLTKVSSFNNNNKIFPVLEYYTCTDIEKEALAQKIAWNGMSVGVIGTINDYIANSWSYAINNKTIESKGYIKGQIIRIENLNDEYHLLNSIAKEINMGVFL